MLLIMFRSKLSKHSLKFISLLNEDKDNKLMFEPKDIKFKNK